MHNDPRIREIGRAYACTASTIYEVMENLIFILKASGNIVVTCNEKERWIEAVAQRTYEKFCRKKCATTREMMPLLEDTLDLE